MCGIYCVYNKDGIAQEPDIYKPSLRTMAHRGPDDEGFYLNKNIFIGHRRLSILDLSRNGHQPMISKDNNVIIAYNGEIYNYLELRSFLLSKKYDFVSTSDTEVLLNMYLEYGDRCFEKLRGMWAAVIWDNKAKTLLLSRDRLGLKPLYIYKGNNIIVSSEIKGILCFDKSSLQVDDKVVYKYITRGWLDDTTSTFFSNIKSIEPGICLKIKNNEFSVRKYWRLSVSENSKITSQDLFDKLKETLAAHMQGDVPIAMSLSGGVDSSSIACVLSRSLGMKDKIHAFSICPPFTANETYWINATVGHCKIRHSYIDMGQINYRQIIDETIRFHDEPPPSSSHLYQLILKKKVSALGFKIMLVGEGSDEIFGGYTKLVPIYLTSLLAVGRYRSVLKALPGFKKLTRQSLLAILASTCRYRFTNAGARSIQLNRFGYEIFNKDFRYQDTEAFPDIDYDPVIAIKEGRHFFSELLDRFRIDINYILKIQDRNGMACGIEVRPPFLDHELVEFAFSFPFDKFMHNGINKFILREAVKGVLSLEVYNCSHKMGRPGNNAHLVYDILSSDMIDFLNSSDFISKRMWNKKCPDFFRRDLKTRNPDNAYVWFRLFMLNRWHNLKVNSF